MRIKNFIIPFLVALLCAGFVAYGFFAAGRNEPLLEPLQQNIALAWPAVGDAAIGSMEDGLLARSSNREKMRPMASMAKVITALAIMEKQPFKPGQQGQTYTLSSNDMVGRHAYISAGGSALPMRAGMKLTQYQALQRMLMASDNIMADILAERIFGSMKAYTLYAQKMLNRMCLSRTVVTDASGFNQATMSTPSDLIVLGIAAMKSPVIAGIVGQRQVKQPVAGILTNTNQILGRDGVIGIKTGTTDKAGSCLLFAARCTNKDGQKRTIVGVIMGDKNHSKLYSDASNLLASARYLDTEEVQSTKIVEHSPKRMNLPRKH